MHSKLLPTDSGALPKEFRLEPLIASAAEVERRNLEEGRSRARRFELTEIALNRIAKTRSVGIDRLDSWLYHPDERVPIAVLQSPHAGKPGSRRAIYNLSRLLPRALEEAKVRGELWTPLFEALSNSIWEGTPYHRRKLTDAQTLSEGGYIIWDSEWEYLNTLVRPWIAQTYDCNSLWTILKHTSSAGLAKAIAEFSPRLDEKLVHCLANHAPLSLYAITDNTNLSPELSQQLLDIVVDRATRQDQDEHAGTAPNRGRGDQHTRMFIVYRKLCQRGVFKLRQDQIDRLLAARSTRIKKNGETISSLRDEAFVILMEYIIEAKDHDTAIRYMKTASELKEYSWISNLIRKSHWRTSILELTPALAHLALDFAGESIRVLQAIAEWEHLRIESSVRKRLFASRKSEGLLLNLALECTPAEASLLVKSLAPKHPEVALGLLRTHRDTVLNELTPKDLASLLKSENRQIRLEAIAMIAEMPAQPAQGKRTVDRGARRLAK